MALFTSKREKRLWFWLAVVLLAIYSTLGLARPLAQLLRERGLISNLFWLGLFLVALTVLWQGLKKRPHKTEIAIWLGVMAVYILVMARMAIPEERSHLIEYSVVGIIIHEALKERASNGKRIPKPAVLAIFITALAGLIDECIQALLPNRIFDLFDISFNALAGLMAIGSSSLISWVRARFG